MLEEERIRRERDDAVFQKKLDMERRMREMEQLLAEKQREKEEAIMRKKQEKIAEMERQLREMDSAAGMEDEYNTALTDVEARKWQAKAQALEDQLRAGGGGGGGGGLSVAQEQALAAREAELAARAKQMEGMMAKLDKVCCGDFAFGCYDYYIIPFRDVSPTTHARARTHPLTHASTHASTHPRSRSSTSWRASCRSWPSWRRAALPWAAAAAWAWAAAAA